MFEYVEGLPEALDCPICRSTLQDPIEITACQHIFCSKCLGRWDSPSCPIDRTPFETSGIRRASALVRSMLDDAKVSCLECAWQGKREDWNSHACATPSTSHQSMEEPVESSREDYAREDCAHCGQEAVGDDADHYLQCPDVLLPCPHSKYGCTSRTRRADLPSHTASCQFEQIKGVFSYFEDRLNSVEDENRTLRGQVASLTDQVQGLQTSTQTSLAPYYNPPNGSSLYSKLSNLSNITEDLTHSLASLDMKTDMQIAAETLRLQEEMQVLRQHLNGVRMQVWQLIMADKERRELPLPRGADGQPVPPAGFAGFGPAFRRPPQDTKL